VWYFSLAGHFTLPTKMEIDGDDQWVMVTGRKYQRGARVAIGGFLYLGSDNIHGPPAADIRSCYQFTYSGYVPEGYTGVRDDDGYGSALLGGSEYFKADEIEVLSSMLPSSARRTYVFLSVCLWLSSFLFLM